MRKETSGRAAPDADLRDRLQEARGAIQEAIRASQAWRAWQLLLERGASSDALGARAYTEEALAAFTAAWQRDPTDIGVVHHLAIGHHARAWDLEIARDPRAAAAWTEALGHWRTLAASSEFWTRLEHDLTALDSRVDGKPLRQLRADLLEHLLDVHVEFVRHYCESDEPARAVQHLELVQRAKIPPALKKRLIGKVFRAMTAAVPEARLAGAYEVVLVTVERFLAVVPDYLPALRMHAELACDRLSGLSYERWTDIVALSTRCEPHVRLLAAHERLWAEPLAATAFEALTWEFTTRGLDRGSHHEDGDWASLSTTQRDAAREGYELGIVWGRLGLASNAKRVRSVFGQCVGSLVVMLHREVKEIWDADVPDEDKDATCLSLYRKAERLVQEVVDVEPDESNYAWLLNFVREKLAALGELPAVAVSTPRRTVPSTTKAPPVSGEKAAGSRPSPNPWRSGPLLSNPYGRTAFRIARVQRGVVERKRILERVRQTRQLVEADPSAHRIGGREVTKAEITAAEQTLLDPRERMLDELLEHAVERLPVDDVRKLAAEAIARITQREPLRVENLSGLTPWLERIVEQFLDAERVGDPSFGALELTLDRPWGDHGAVSN
jgi:hypothetical protein